MGELTTQQQKFLNSLPADVKRLIDNMQDKEKTIRLVFSVYNHALMVFNNRKSEEIKSIRRKGCKHCKTINNYESDICVQCSKPLKKFVLVSENGRPWGRKPTDSKIVKEVLSLRQQGKTYREISTAFVLHDKKGNVKNLPVSTIYDILLRYGYVIPRDDYEP